MRRACPAVLMLTCALASEVEAQAPAAPVYLVYYWRARPGKLAAYSDYIRTVAEPIDEHARQAGVFSIPTRPSGGR